MMKLIKIEKLTLNFGSGKEQSKLDKGFVLLERISKSKPIKTVTKKRIPTWGLRPGLPIGCKVTIRKEKAKELIKNLLVAKENKLKKTNFDEQGNISFGIPEYIDIPGVEYDPKIGVIGLQACITLERPGYRVKKRKLSQRDLGKKHIITKEEAIDFMKKQYGVNVE